MTDLAWATGATPGGLGSHSIEIELDEMIASQAGSQSFDSASDASSHRSLTRSAPPGALPAVGDMLSRRYILEEILGKGASAVVYRAIDTVLDQTVAIKVLLLDGVNQTDAAKRIGATLRAEARAAMKLSHPGILRVFNYEVDSPWEYIVMEFVFGENLSEYRKRQPEKRLTPEETCARGVESCLALAYAHGQGIVHHDIKPHNVMLTRSGRVKLCDFGLARMAGMTWSGGAHAGTPAFISPERVRGDEGDARSDLYSLAATLYLLGNGRTLFGSKVEQAVQGHLSQSVPASPHLPPAVHAVLEKALQKNPKDRYANAREMGEALMEAAQAGRRKETPTSAGSAEAARTTPAAGPAPTSSPASREPAPAAPPRTSLAPDRAARMSLRAGAPRLRVPEDMVIVEACEVGSAYGGSYPVPKFAMERTPVTNEQYFAFVKATGARSPDHWRKGAPPRDRLKHPVVGITLAEARLYAEHLGRRLPTCLEWEAAARSPDGRAFPWGDEFDPSRCNGPERSGGDTVAVDRYAQGASPVGCVDMVGNVWEWTEPDPRVAAPDTADGVWVLGGSYCHPCAKNDAIARTAVSEAKSYLYLGFRCALSEEKDVI